MKKLVLFTMLFFSFCNQIIWAHGLAGHVNHLDAVLALNDQYYALVSNPKYQPYFLYGTMFPDMQYSNKYKTSLAKLYTKIRETVYFAGIPANGLTYEIGTANVPDSDYPFGIDTHDEKYGFRFAEYLLNACAPIDPPGPNPGSNGTTISHDARNMKLAFALGYYCHLATDVACHDFLVPKVTAQLNLGDIQVVRNPSGFRDPNAQMEGIIETIVDYHYGNPNQVKTVVMDHVWVHTDQFEPTIAQMDFTTGYPHLFYNGPSPAWYPGGSNPVLLFYRAVLNDWITNNPNGLPLDYRKGSAISDAGLREMATIFRFVNRFYPAIAGHQDISQELGQWIGNHIDWPLGVDIIQATLEFFSNWTLWSFRETILQCIAYPKAIDEVRKDIPQEIRTLTSLMLSNMGEADLLAVNSPDKINLTEYAKLKASILFTNPHSILQGAWNEYKNLGTVIYDQVGPSGKWLSAWSPFHENSMRWGAQSSLNNLLTPIYSVNSSIAVYDAYFTINGRRITGPEPASSFIGNPSVQAIVEVYNTSNVAPVNVTLRVRKDHRTAGYSSDPIVASTSAVVDQDPLQYNSVDRQKIQLTFPVSDQDLITYWGYYLELAGTDGKAFFTSSWEQYKTLPQVANDPFYMATYDTYNRWPISLGTKSAYNLDLLPIASAETEPTSGTYKVNGFNVGATWHGESVAGSDPITLEAVPSTTGWVCASWSDGKGENPRQFTATGHSSLRATLKKHLFSTSPQATTTNNQRKIAQSSNGTYCIAYESSNRVWFSKSSDGVNWSNDFPVSDGSLSTLNRYPSLVVKNDIANVVWQSTGMICYIYLRSYNIVTDTWGELELVSAFDTGDPNFLSTPVIAAHWLHAGSDRKRLAWRERDGINIIDYSSEFGWGTIGHVPGTSGSCYFPSIANESGSGYALCWENASAQTIQYIECYYDQISQAWTFLNSAQISQYGWYMNQRPSLAIGCVPPGCTSRKVTIAWQSVDNVVEGVSVHVRDANFAGNNWGNITSYSMSTAATPHPVIGSYETNNQLRLLWNESNNVYLATFNGSSWSAPSLLATGADGGTECNINSAAPSQVAALWRKPSGQIAVTVNPGGPQQSIGDGPLSMEGDSSNVQYRRNRHGMVRLTQALGHGNGRINGMMAFEIARMKLVTPQGEVILEFSNESSSHNAKSLLSSMPFSVNSPSTILLFAGAAYGKRLAVPEDSIRTVSQPIARVVLRQRGSGAVRKQIWTVPFSDLTVMRDSTYGTFRTFQINLDDLAGREVYVDVEMLGHGRVEPLINDDYLILPSGSPSFPGNPLGKTVERTTPTSYSLYQNYPNPFNPSTVIRFDLPEAQVVSLKVFNVLGQEVATLASGVREAGEHSVTADFTNLPSGMYIYRMKAGTFTNVKKLLLVK